jgi:hypothetical protein
VLGVEASSVNAQRGSVAGERVRLAGEGGKGRRDLGKAGADVGSGRSGVGVVGVTCVGAGCRVAELRSTQVSAMCLSQWVAFERSNAVVGVTPGWLRTCFNLDPALSFLGAGG